MVEPWTAIVRSDAVTEAAAQLHHEQQEGNDFDDFVCHKGLKLIKTLRLGIAGGECGEHFYVMRPSAGYLSESRKKEISQIPLFF